jgi:phospholipid transport system transporter-binding protein
VKLQPDTPAVLERDGERLRVSGGLTMTTIGEAIDVGAKALREGVKRVNLAGVTEVDSAAIALLLDWSRQSQASFVIEGAPSTLRDFAKLYSVETFLPFEAA